ncbi:MAG: hypothetical protein NVS1B2_11150 [Vulcanimicrobiaceae bacterium]
MIHIGVDAWGLIDNPRGTGRYTREILAAWDARFSDRVRLTLVVPENFSFFYARRYRAEAADVRARVRSRARPGRFDAWWFPFNGPSWNRWRGRSVATLHDASPMYARATTPAALDPMHRAIERCDRIVTDSTCAARDLADAFGTDEGRFIPVHLGADPRPVCPPTIDPRPYGRFVLYVGGTEARKDLPTMFATMRIVQARHPDVRFVLIGPETVPIPAHPGVHADLLGVVDDATLAAFYRACSAFLYASTFEGFGLPVLEAQGYGAPVVAANASSLPEAGGTAALYAVPGEPQDFASKILELLERPDVALDVIARGRAHAAQKTWSVTAEKLLAVFEDLVS